MARRRLLSIACLLSLWVLSGCGGGGRDGGASTSTPNHTPVANAGSDQTIHKNVTVTLDGAASTDADADSLSYRWAQTAGPAVALSSTSASQPTFVAPAQSGKLSFSLIVSDGKTESVADTVDVTVTNTTPVAATTGDLSAQVGSQVTLSGLSSTDADGDPLTYQWTQLSGPTVSLTAASPGITKFVAPNSTTVLVFALTVSDGEASSIQITVIVNVATNVTNRAPTAIAYSPTLTVAKRSSVYLYGYGSDPDGNSLTYRWTQVSGPTVTLNTPNSPFANFTAPANETVLGFELTTSDGSLSSKPASATVTVKNYAPYVSASLTPTPAYTNDDLTVSKSATDTDGDSIDVSYAWQRNGVTVSSQTGPTFPASLTTKGDVIKVSVSASDGTTTTAVDASTTIADSTPVLSATGAPTAIDYGNTMSFTISATDADGDNAGAFKVLYGPAGFNVDSTGNVSWHATGPMFDRAMDFDWAVGVSNYPTAMLTGTVRVTDANRQYPLRRQGMEIPANHNAMVVTDLNGDGVSEILVAGNSALQERKKNGSSYEISWEYPFDFSEGTGNLQAVAASDIDGDGKQEIFASAGTVVVRLDGVNRRESAHRNLGTGKYCVAMKIADLDGDGAKEIVCLVYSSYYYYYGSNASISVLNANTLATLWETSPAAIGTSIAVGNVDADSALEVVTSGGYVYDGSTRQNQWAYGPGFGFLVETGDVDGDGVEEIVGAIDWTAVRGFSATSKSPLWEKTKSDIDELRVFDSDGDGKAEVFVGDGQWGNVTAYKFNTTTNTLDQSFQINSQNHGVTSIGAGDVDGDGALEFVWGTGASTSGADQLIIAGLNPTITVEWKSAETDQFGSYYGGQLANIGGGASRLIFGTPRTASGYSGMRLIGLDTSNGRFTTSNEIDTNWDGVGTLDVADYDGDGVQEIFLGASQTYSGYLAAYDFAANTKEWTSAQANSNATAAITHADFNADGYADLVRISNDSHIEIYDVKNSTLIWRSTGLGGYGVDVAVADLDGDGQREIVAITYERLYVYGRASQTAPFLERANYQLDSSWGTYDLAAADMDGDNTPEIYVLHNPNSSNTSIYVFNPQLQLLRTLNLGVAGTSITVEQSGFSRKNLLVGTSTQSSYYPYNGDSQIWAVDPVTGADIWRSPSLLGSIAKNSLFSVDTNNDGINEISFATSSGFYITR